MTDYELQSALRALGRRLEATEPDPDLAARVVARLPRGLPPRDRRSWSWLRPALIAAVLLLVGVATAVAASDTIRGWLHDRGIDVQSVPTLPDTVTVRTIADLDAGRQVTEAEAERLLGRPLPSSEALGLPAAILAAESPEPAVTLVWTPTSELPAPPTSPRIAALLTIATSDLTTSPGLFAKSLGGQTQAEFVTVANSGEAVWITGAPHAVTLFDRTTTRFRLAANVLIWSYGGDVLRLESALDRDRAIEIAESLDR